MLGFILLICVQCCIGIYVDRNPEYTVKVDNLLTGYDVESINDNIVNIKYNPPKVRSHVIWISGTSMEILNECEHDVNGVCCPFTGKYGMCDHCSDNAVLMENTCICHHHASDVSDACKCNDYTICHRRHCMCDLTKEVYGYINEFDIRNDGMVSGAVSYDGKTLNQKHNIRTAIVRELLYRGSTFVESGILGLDIPDGFLQRLVSNGRVRMTNASHPIVLKNVPITCQMIIGEKIKILGVLIEQLKDGLLIDDKVIPFGETFERRTGSKHVIYGYSGGVTYVIAEVLQVRRVGDGAGLIVVLSIAGVVVCFLCTIKTPTQFKGEKKPLMF